MAGLNCCEFACRRLDRTSSDSERISEAVSPLLPGLASVPLGDGEQTWNAGDGAPDRSAITRADLGEVAIEYTNCRTAVPATSDGWLGSERSLRSAAPRTFALWGLGDSTPATPPRNCDYRRSVVTARWMEPRDYLSGSAAYPQSHPVTLEDIAATIDFVLGLTTGRRIYDS